MYIIKREHSSLLYSLYSYHTVQGLGIVEFIRPAFLRAVVCLSASCNILLRQLDVYYVEAAASERLTFQLWPLRSSGSGGFALGNLSMSAEIVARFAYK